MSSNGFPVDSDRHPSLRFLVERTHAGGSGDGECQWHKSVTGAKRKKGQLS